MGHYKGLVVTLLLSWALLFFGMRVVGQKAVAGPKYELIVLTCPHLTDGCTADLQKLSLAGWEVKALDTVLFPLENWKTRVVLQREVK